MLPSLGCFSLLECPFFNGGAGQCSRPYCHYRHVKKDPNAPPDPAEEILGPVPTSEPSQVEDVAKAGTSSGVPNKSRASTYRAIVEAAPEYNPTPISQLKSSHIPIPYTPTVPTRSSAVRKNKPSSEYVPHPVGTSRPSYPPYCPSSISSLNSQVQSTALSDPLKNPLYEIYGPEGAQYSPNDVEPMDSAYSYAPVTASYAPETSSYTPYSPEYVPSKVTYNPRSSPQDSQLSDDDDNVDLAEETAAQTNGVSGGGESLIDLDLSELDNLELEFEDDGNTQHETRILEDESSKINRKSQASHKEESGDGKRKSIQKGEKRRSSSTSSTSEAKKHKSEHSNDRLKADADKSKSSRETSHKNGHKEKKSSSSSSSSKRSSSSTSSHSKKSSSQSSSSKNESSSSKPSKSSSSSESKRSHSSDSKSKSGSSSSSSKHKDKHREKEKHREREKDKHHSRDKDSEKSSSKEKERPKDKDSSKSKKSSHRSSDEKEKKELQREKIEEELRKIEVELDASLEDEDMIEQQCFEMFSEYSETLQNNPAPKIEDQRVTVNEEPVSSLSNKKRIAHQASHASLQPNPKPVPTLAKKCSPYQVMRDRWEMLKKEKLQSIEKKTSLAVAPPSVPRPSAPVPYSSTSTPQAALPHSSKKKIAGVPNVAMLLKPPSVSNTVTSSSSNLGMPPNRFYNVSSQRVDEYGRLVKVRVAHTPNMESPTMRKPVVNPSDCRKFKVATRQANVNKLYQAYLDAGFGEASHDMALESEKTSTQGTESLGVYSHRIIQTLKDLRACAETSQNGPKLDGMSGIPNRVVSHNAMLAGKLGAKVSWSIQSIKKESESKAHLSLYEQLKSYILTKEQLEENGYPMPSGEKGVASIKPSAYRTITQPSDPRQKICVRCLKPYAINKRGEQVKEEECFYHWGRKFTTRQFRQAETKYTCCDSTGSGCSVSPYHVFEQKWDKTSGYMSTLSKPSMESDPGVYALDCEMCYTTAGLELTRVTVIKEDLSVVYETLVKPSHKILDYNTRYSGITEDDLKAVTTTILQVQATLLGMFCDKTILIGHSLESDMKALKLIHPTVIDTSVVFPHKMGPPQKRALRNLAADYLKKIIQNDVGGHDSKEDAVAAMELMLWRLKEDEKTR